MCPWKKGFFFPNPFSKKLKFVLEKKNTKKVITDLVISNSPSNKSEKYEIYVQLCTKENTEELMQ